MTTPHSRIPSTAFGSRVLPGLGALALLSLGAVVLAAGCSSKKDEEPKTDDDIWAEATGEEPLPEDEDEEEEAADDTEAEPAGAAGDEAGGEDGSEADGDEDDGEESGEEDDDTTSAADRPTPTERLADGGALYGAPFDDDLPRVDLPDLLAHADRYEGQVVRTEGQVARVCQAMGCWMELREGEDGDPIRVPMAGHAFFLPKDAAGRRAEVAGRIEVAALDPEQQAHLRAEGAQAASQPVSLTATGVVLR